MKKRLMSSTHIPPLILAKAVERGEEALRRKWAASGTYIIDLNDRNYGSKPFSL